MTSVSKFIKEKQFPQVVVLILLLVLLAVGAIPSYLKGRWEWREPPKIVNLKQLKQIRQKGISIPGWKTVEQREQEIGSHKWSYQLIQKEGQQTNAIVLLLPQNGPRDQPQVEWTEIDSLWQWQIAQNRAAEFTVKQPQTSGSSNTEIKVQANFFRATANKQSFAVLQWYAWPTGGSASQISWFLADLSAQWNKHRAQWVAVCILLPMEPLGQVEKTWNEVKSIGQSVQSTLVSGPFNAAKVKNQKSK
ncbi:cyanoexosortase B system-associated protein [Scytonema sp. NUACC26]|uniref:cyanoexosortase B system-associated protein n=1 Tax=Scytonema sp. NUACC26 TaxID=3140176 RepID=UPI0034DBC3A8